MSKYVYFVSYFKGGTFPNSFGNCEIFTDHPITVFEKVTEIGRVIDQDKGWAPGSAIVLNFQLLSMRGGEQS